MATLKIQDALSCPSFNCVQTQMLLFLEWNIFQRIWMVRGWMVAFNLLWKPSEAMPTHTRSSIGPEMPKAATFYEWKWGSNSENAKMGIVGDFGI